MNMILTGNALSKAKFAPSTPFEIQLSDNQSFQATQIIRLAPKKRLIVYGTWQGKQVVAKIFFNSRRKTRHLQRELESIEALKKRNILIPALYFQGNSADDKMHVLLFERIQHIKNPEFYGNASLKNPFAMQYLLKIIAVLAELHSQGILQNDLHVDNFLVTDHGVYTIDGAQMDFSSFALSKEMSIDNLALFFSNIGCGVKEHLRKIFQHYIEVRGWDFVADDFVQFRMKIKNYKKAKWQRLRRKIFSESSAFSPVKGWFQSGMFNREYAGSEFLNFLKNPEAVFNQAVFLEKMGMMTMVKTKLDNRFYIIKQYGNTPNAVLQRSRAARAWELSHKLNYFNFPTLKPVAFLEKKFLGRCYESYYVVECG